MGFRILDPLGASPGPASAAPNQGVAERSVQPFSTLRPEQRELLMLLALDSQGFGDEDLAILYRCVGDGVDVRFDLRGLRRQLQPLAVRGMSGPLPWIQLEQYGIPNRIVDPALRQEAFGHLLQSSLPARWRRALQPAESAQRRGVVSLANRADACQRLAMLAGASRGQCDEVFPRGDAGSRQLRLRENLQRLRSAAGHLSVIDRLHPEIAILCAAEELAAQRYQARAETPALLALVTRYSNSVDRWMLPSPELLLDHACLRGDWARAREIAESELERQIAGLVESALGEATLAELLRRFTEIEDQLPREVVNRREALVGVAGVLHLLARAASGEERERKRLAQVLRRSWSQPEASLIAQVGPLLLLAAEAGVNAGRIDLPQPEPHRHQYSLALLVAALVHQWLGEPLSDAWRSRMAEHAGRADQAQWPWVAAILRAALGEAPPPSGGPWHWRQPESPWQRALRALEQFAGPAVATDRAEKPVAPSRIQARVQRKPLPSGMFMIELFELRPTTKGRMAATSLLYPGPMNKARGRLPSEDLAGHRLLQQVCTSGYPSQYFTPDHEIFAALVDYPDVQLVDGGELHPLRVESRPAQLRMQSLEGGRMRLAFDPPPSGERRRRLDFEDGRLLVTEYTPEQLRLHAALGDRVELPAEAVAQLLELAPRIASRLPLHTDIDNSLLVEDLDTRIHVLLERAREGVLLRLRVRPLGAAGVLLLPGAGQEELLGLREGQPVHGHRDLAAEGRELDALLAEIPALEGAEGGDILHFPDPEQALDLLSRLTQYGERVELVWPERQKIRVSGTRGMDKLALRLRSKRDWFQAEGGLTLEDGEVVSLATLLEALPSSQGRFLRLGEERVLALSQELARQLRGLAALADDKGRVQLAGVAVQALEPLIEAAGEVHLDAAFKAQRKRIAEAGEREHPLPSGLQAELRDYQVEGYRWMMRLADWGAGACLADDMGLGKTLQALAVICARAGEGPALVVAPTSVVANWRQEARRFAPGLELRVFGDGDRERVLEDLGPGCVLLVSYGLLTLHIERFAAVRFATLVLDEAQAIKNAAAQRSQAVREIDAAFRIATTGTPIENHLGELWSLMRVLNPGLLGSQERFARKFMLPMERNPRAPEREVLRRLIAPFLLRRLKSQVLEELPPRTEIVIQVTPSAEEERLLAALRRQAQERLAAGELPEEAKRFHVLAELTRLRRAACHPQLVAPELGLPGSKLNQLLELVQELKENRHRALVFSQFTDYLALVRSALDQAGHSYQYLDGQTPPKAREAAVAAFQRGEGDLFLLSLKAGGVGLNLTAADYVIHLDPWWNPAVEQQATDRAHRIGQTRPVTVYKLVVQGSIEEQILALHGSKRELADSVLGDQDQAARISVEELLALLGEQHKD